MYWRILVCVVFSSVALFQLADLGVPQSIGAFDWVPTEEEIRKYRRSWNPFSHGPILISAVDIQPKGQFYIRPFIFLQIGEKCYSNRLTLPTERKDGPVHLYSVQHPFLNSAYKDGTTSKVIMR